MYACTCMRCVEQVFPQTQYDRAANLNADSNRVHFLPNPAVVRVNDFSLAVVNVDVLKHLGAHEVSQGKDPEGRNRMASLAGSLIEQHSLYPLQSPLDSNGLQIDWLRSDLFQLENSPDLLITSSQLKHFAQEVGNQVLAVNIETLAKGDTGGMYGLVSIHPHVEQDLANLSSLLPRARVDLIRI